MTPFTTVALSAALMAVTNAKTLIIGGGPAGVHMGYRLQKWDEPACIWEMTDQLGGKAGNQYEMDDGITMNTGVNFAPTAYREVFKLLDELGMKNRNEAKKMAAPVVVDQFAKCLLINNFDETKCQDLTVYSSALLAQPIGLFPFYSLVRGIILMKEEGYFDTFVEITTEQGFDWTAEVFDLGTLVGLHAQRVVGTEVPAYRAYLDQYTDGAFSDSTNLDNDFNKYAVYDKSDDAKEALNQKALNFMQDKEIYFFRVFVEQFVTGLGYGNLDDTPLYYVGMMMNPTYTDFWFNTITNKGAPDPDPFPAGLYMLEGGLPRALDNMVTKQNLDVQFNREVTKVVHVQEDDDSSYFEVYYKDNDLQSVFNRKLKEASKSNKGNKKGKSSKSETKPPPNMERFDQVISGMSSQNFVKIYNKGEEIQQPFLCREACAWSSTIAEVAPSDLLVGYFDSKAAVFGRGSFYLEDPSIGGTALIDPLRVKGVPLENDGGSRRMQMYHQYAYEPVLSSDTQALTKQELDTLFDERYGAGGLEITEVYSTVIVPNYSATSKDLNTCDPWDVHDLQGKNGLYFIGGTVNFDNLELLVRYNNYILDTHFKPPPPPTQPGLSCQDSDIIYFNSKFAEFMDKMSNAAEALAVAAAADRTAASAGYAGGVRSGTEVAFTTFMEGIAANDFNMKVQQFQRDKNVDGPSSLLRYDNLDRFLNGPASWPPGGVLPLGYYAFNPIAKGRFANPNGGQSGHSDCDYRAGTGVGASTAISRTRTIDVFVATDARTDINGDGFFENESYTGKVTITWEASADGWLMKQVVLVAGALGYTSYGYVDLVDGAGDASSSSANFFGYADKAPAKLFP